MGEKECKELIDGTIKLEEGKVGKQEVKQGGEKPRIVGFLDILKEKTSEKKKVKHEKRGIFVSDFGKHPHKIVQLLEDIVCDGCPLLPHDVECPSLFLGKRKKYEENKSAPKSLKWKMHSKYTQYGYKGMMKHVKY